MSDRTSTVDAQWIVEIRSGPRVGTALRLLDTLVIDALPIPESLQELIDRWPSLQSQIHTFLGQLPHTETLTLHRRMRNPQRSGSLQAVAYCACCDDWIDLEVCGAGSRLIAHDPTPGLVSGRCPGSYRLVETEDIRYA